jgi:hypothetical protein
MTIGIYDPYSSMYSKHDVILEDQNGTYTQPMTRNEYTGARRTFTGNAGCSSLYSYCIIHVRLPRWSQNAAQPTHKSSVLGRLTKSVRRSMSAHVSGPSLSSHAFRDHLRIACVADLQPPNTVQRRPAATLTPTPSTLRFRRAVLAPQ